LFVPIATGADKMKAVTITRFHPLGEKGLFNENEPLQFKICGRNNTAQLQQFIISFTVKDFFNAPE
jgi:hypothetical protein